MTPNDRTKPGVCPRCSNARWLFDGLGTKQCPVCVPAVETTVSDGTGQQPAQPRLCCRKHESEDLNGSIFGRHFIVCPTCQDKRCAHADDCANSCTGQQPAQPDKSHVTYNADGSVSIDVRAAAQQYARNRHAREHPKDPVTNGVAQPAQPDSGGVMDDAALEATFRHIERWSELDLPVCANLRIHCKAMQSALIAAQRDRNAQYDRAQKVSQHSSRLWSEREALRDKLAAEQQRIAALERENADLRARLNHSERLQGRYPRDAV